MAGKIFLPGNLRGRLGNQLFAVNMALQLSKFFDVPVSIPLTSNTKILNLPRMRFVNFDRLITHKGLKIESKEFLSNSDSNLLFRIRQSLLNDTDIILPTTLLGEGFFRYSFLHPRELIQLRDQKHSNEFSESVALHFRGTDFVTWNPLAIMNHSFYMNSIDFLKVKDLEINIFSDDPGSRTVERLLKYLPRSKLYSDASLGKTFSALSQHRYIVASPSTFSLWAALLGSSSTFVISKEWIDGMTAIGDEFWPQVERNEKLYFNRVFAL